MRGWSLSFCLLVFLVSLRIVKTVLYFVDLSVRVKDRIECGRFLNYNMPLVSTVLKWHCEGRRCSPCFPHECEIRLPRERN